ncbi:hypothetical protein Q5L94_08440 [Idiomarina sp. Sol25]|uniref:hypothetical protein n=1 Tax=Idiomarina sp. Sol25 TaxID=3064000 RepID=UPI00294B7A0C|nr:hypothetical protein [Idiomarina sp. Sol25]MDV6328085.1 hypothetical protein [Idiomarina sp. Sol25]
MDFSELNKIESEIINKNYHLALKYIEQFIVKRPNSLVGLILKIRVLNKLSEHSCFQSMQESIDSFINSCKKSGKRTLDFWPALSVCYRHVMARDKEKLVEFISFLEKKKKKVKNRPNILILTCVWKRHELTECFYQYYSRIQRELKDTIDLQLLAVGSEKSVSRLLCEQYGFDYVEFDNQPLTQKWQAGMDASKSKDFDAMVILGSDDFVEKDVFFLYKKALDRNVHFYGFRDMYIYDVPSKCFGHWLGYGSAPIDQLQPQRVGETIGLGRFLSRALLEYLSFNIWETVEENRGLDRLMKESLIEKTGLFPVACGDEYEVSVNGELHRLGLVADTFEAQKLVGVDVKHDTNVTDFRKYNISPECFIEKSLDDIASLSFSRELKSFNSRINRV